MRARKRVVSIKIDATKAATCALEPIAAMRTVQNVILTHTICGTRIEKHHSRGKPARKEQQLLKISSVLPLPNRTAANRAH